VVDPNRMELALAQLGSGERPKERQP
jgi:hypothetical protein